MKLLRKGKIITDLLFNLLHYYQGDKMDLMKFFDKILDKKSVEDKFQKRMDLLFRMMGDYTDKLKEILNDKEIVKVKQIWKVLIRFYSKSCNLILY